MAPAVSGRDISESRWTFCPFCRAADQNMEPCHPRGCYAYWSIVADHVQPFTEVILPEGCGLSQQAKAAEMVQEWFEVLTRPSNSPDLNPIEGLWDVLDKDVCSMKAPPQSLQDCVDGAATTAQPQGCSGRKGGPTQYQTGVYDVTPDWCVLIAP